MRNRGPAYTLAMPVDPSETRASAWVVTVDTVFPNQTNPIGTLFGGRVLELMDVNASIACARFCRQAVVTASTELTGERPHWETGRNTTRPEHYPA